MYYRYVGIVSKIYRFIYIFDKYICVLYYNNFFLLKMINCIGCFII